VAPSYGFVVTVFPCHLGPSDPVMANVVVNLSCMSSSKGPRILIAVVRVHQTWLSGMPHAHPPTSVAVATLLSHSLQMRLHADPLECCEAPRDWLALMVQLRTVSRWHQLLGSVTWAGARDHSVSDQRGSFNAQRYVTAGNLWPNLTKYLPAVSQ